MQHNAADLILQEWITRHPPLVVAPGQCSQALDLLAKQSGSLADDGAPMLASILPAAAALKAARTVKQVQEAFQQLVAAWRCTRVELAMMGGENRGLRAITGNQPGRSEGPVVLASVTLDLCVAMLCVHSRGSDSIGVKADHVPVLLQDGSWGWLGQLTTELKKVGGLTYMLQDDQTKKYSKRNTVTWMQYDNAYLR